MKEFIKEIDEKVQYTIWIHKTAESEDDNEKHIRYYVAFTTKTQVVNLSTKIDSKEISDNDDDFTNLQLEEAYRNMIDMWNLLCR